MSGELFQCGYGAIVAEDVQVLEKCLEAALVNGAPFGAIRSTLYVLEIGMHDGGTAKGIEAWCKAHGCVLKYTGIDPDDGKTRRATCQPTDW